MGVSYEFNADCEEVTLTGIACDDDLGTVKLNYTSMMRQFKELMRKDEKGELTEKEEQQLETLQEFIEEPEGDE